MKEEIKKIINGAHLNRQLIWELNNLKNDLFTEIGKIVFSQNSYDCAFLGKLLIISDDDLIREKEMNLNNEIKNFSKEIYSLREMVQNIMPVYFPKYRIEKIFKNEKPDFIIQLSDKKEIGVECCSLLVVEQYENYDKKLWSSNIGCRVSSYEHISNEQISKFKKHLENGNETIYLFNFGSGARFICAEINKILTMQKIAKEMMVNIDNIFVCIGKSGIHKTAYNNWIKLFDISKNECCVNAMW